MASRFRDFDEAFRWLAARTNYETMATQDYDERTYGLSRVHDLLDAAGRPDRTMDVVQIVGSKGKGSASAMAAEILSAGGRRTGLYTSPHLVDARERIRVDGRAADDAPVVAALGTLRGHVEAAAGRGEPCTFFEIHTVAALLAFRAAGCTAVVLEAGMGGRLDATTAAEARAVALTTVSLDHTRQLGDTLPLVAREKAAAARAGRPFVCGERAGSAGFDAITAACAAVGARLVLRGRDFDVGEVSTALDAATGTTRTAFAYTDTHGRLDLASPLLGRHQADNAAVAVALVRAAGFAPTDEAIARGIAAARPRARLEVVGRAPLVLVDGAHSPASFVALAATIEDAVPHRPRVFVVGMAADKDVNGALAQLAGVADLVVATTSGAVRAAAPDIIASAARTAGLRAETAPDHVAALRVARERAGPRGVVVVTGSLYLCGALLADATRPDVDTSTAM